MTRMKQAANCFMGSLKTIGFSLVLTGAVAATISAYPHAALADGHGGKGHSDKIMPYEYAIASDMADQALLLDAVETGNRLVAVGEFGHILLSDDRGANWRQAQSVPTRNTLTSVVFLDNQTGYATGHEATILKTTDGGENWELKYIEMRGEDPLFGIYFSDAKNGITVGGFSKVFETKDGGETWAARALVEDSYDDFHLNDVFPDKAGNLYIPAEFGTVYKSRDRGVTWEAIQTDYDGSFWGGMGLSNGDIMVFGMRGNAFISSNNGASWQKVDTGTDNSITGGAQLSDGRIVLTGLSGAVLVSSDNGRKFAYTERPDRLSFATAMQGADGNVILFGTPGIKNHAISE